MERKKAFEEVQETIMVDPSNLDIEEPIIL